MSIVSSKPRKQRKLLYNAPYHKLSKLMSAQLS
ncbi:MAG: 60S ribosomal protein L26, partial [Nitrososphaerota archaeon]